MTKRNPWYEPIPIATPEESRDAYLHPGRASRCSSWSSRPRRESPDAYFLPDRAGTRALDPGAPVCPRTPTTRFARVIVGLARGSRPVRGLDVLAEAWRRYAAASGLRLAESVVLQRGRFTIDSGRAVRENGAVLTALHASDATMARMPWQEASLIWFGCYVAACLEQRTCVVQAGHGSAAGGDWTVYPHIPRHMEGPSDGENRGPPGAGAPPRRRTGR